MDLAIHESRHNTSLIVHHIIFMNYSMKTWHWYFRQATLHFSNTADWGEKLTMAAILSRNSWLQGHIPSQKIGLRILDDLSLDEQENALSRIYWVANGFYQLWIIICVLRLDDQWLWKSFATHRTYKRPLSGMNPLMCTKPGRRGTSLVTYRTFKWFLSGVGDPYVL